MHTVIRLRCGGKILQYTSLYVLWMQNFAVRARLTLFVGLRIQHIFKMFHRGQLARRGKVNL